MRYLIILLLVIQTGLYSQAIYFNKAHYTDTTSILTVSGLPIQNGYLIAGGFNAPNDYSAFFIRKLDIYGNQVEYYILDGDTVHDYRTILFGNSMIQTHDDFYLMSSIRGLNDTNRNTILTKFNEQGQIFWQKNYETPSDVEGNVQLVKTIDGGYLIAGWQYHIFTSGSFGDTKFHIVKVDEAGEFLWEKRYGVDANLLYAEQTQDGGFILSGYRYSNTTGYDMYVVKTDSLGGLEWQKTFGTEENDGGCKVTQLPNGYYALFGLIDAEELGIDKKLYFAQLDSLGEPIIEQTHTQNSTYSLGGTPYITPDNEIVMMTLAYGGGDWQIAFAKFSFEGDILLEAPIASGLSGEDYIRDIEPTPDGGYLLTGFNYSSPQSSWVVKVDSMGQTCGVAPCDNTSVVSTIGSAVPRSTYPINIYPNPTTGQATIAYELPPEYPFGVLEVYDVQGQKVYTQVLPQGTGQQAVDLTGLVTGIYFYKVVTVDRVLGSGKLVVE